MRIVEMAGLPAAGKSTAEEYVLGALEERRQPALLRADLVRSFVRARLFKAYGPRHWLRRPLSLLYRAEVWRRHLRDRRACGVGLAGLLGPARPAGYWLSEDILLYSHHLAAAGVFGSGLSAGEGARGPIGEGGSGAPIAVLSEGLVHHGAALRTWAGDALEALCRRWTDRRSARPIAVFHLRVTPGTAFKRFWSRSPGPAFPRSTRRWLRSEQTFIRFDEALEASLAQYHAAGACIISLDASGSPLALRGSILRSLDALL